MTLIHDQIISVLQSCADKNRPRPMGTAFPIVVGTAISNQPSQGNVSKMFKNGTVQMVTESNVMSMTAGGMTKSDKCMSPIAKFVATTVKQEVRKVEYVKKGSRI